MAENRRKLLEQKEQEQKMAAAKKVEELAKTGSRMLQEKEKEEKEKQKLRYFPSLHTIVSRLLL